MDNRTGGQAGIKLSENGVVISNSSNYSEFMQYVIADTGKQYTLAVGTGDGVKILSGVPSANPESQFLKMKLSTQGYVKCYIIIPSSEITLHWAALYEGSYTADTLPPYVPKGYAAELAECQRYYKVIDVYVTPWLLERTDLRRYYVGYEPMRTKPTVDVSGLKEYATWTDLVSTLNPYNIKNNRVLISATAETTSTKIYMGGSIALSADL